MSIYKLYRHNIYQDKEISQLELDISTLKFTASVKSEIEWPDETFNYLALGNSITKHEICSYWFDEVGMAASSEKTDYFHIVCNTLQGI